MWTLEDEPFYEDIGLEVVVDIVRGDVDVSGFEYEDGDILEGIAFEFVVDDNVDGV